MEFLHPAMWMWLWNRDSEFTKWQHLQCDTWPSDDMPLNSPKRPPYCNSTSGFAVDISFCISRRNFIRIGPPSSEKMTYQYRDIRRIDIAVFQNDMLQSPLYNLQNNVSRRLRRAVQRRRTAGCRRALTAHNDEVQQIVDVL